MEDFLTSFFITPFTGLAEGIATATSPLDVIDAVDGFVWGPIMILGSSVVSVGEIPA